MSPRPVTRHQMASQVREGVEEKRGRGQVKNVNTNAKFLVIVMCDMSHVTGLKKSKMVWF